MATQVWVATAAIYLNNVRAYNEGYVVPDSVVATFGLEAADLVERRMVNDHGAPSLGLSHVTEIELSAALAALTPAAIGATPLPVGTAQVGQLVSVSAASGGKPTGFGLVETAEITPADIGAQPADTDLTAIAGLIPANDDFMQRKAGAWANRTAAQVKADLGIGGWKSPPAGRYFLPLSQGASATSTTLGNGTLRLVPWLVRGTVTIDRIVGDIATVGEAGSKFRMGIYADNGACYPGSLVVDAGQINGDSATVQELTITPVTLQPGVYWLGGVVQAAPTTQPAVRVVSGATPDVPMSSGGATLPVAAGSATAYANTSVTGALPTTFGTGLAAVASGPRLFLRAA